jgi:uncharacterized membrane protein
MNELRLNKTELSEWYRVAILFLAPVLIIYIGFVLGNMSDGFQWNDFVPNLFVQGAIVAYFLNEALAYFKRLLEKK